MTPDQRLNQIEPELAEVLQKVDRLIEGQGQLIELATDNKAELELVKVELETVKAELSQAKITGEITAISLAKLTLRVSDIQDQLREGFQEVNRRFDRSEQAQQEILTLLRDRLK